MGTVEFEEILSLVLSLNDSPQHAIVFAFDDFLYVLEGAVTITDENGSKTLTPGQAVFIPKGTRVTMEVPDRLVWTYVAFGGSLDWQKTPQSPRAVEEI